MSSSEDQDPEVNEEAEDILGLADIIGIGRSEQEYLWIAKEAYNADLPGGWEIFFDEDGNHFYFDTKKQVSTYTHPSIDYYQKLYRDFKQKDQEFREQQERREIAFGLREAATPDRSKLRITGQTSKAVTPEQARGGSEDDGQLAEEREALAKTRLLQAYSHDPNLASKFRKDIKEQESQASAIMKRSLEKEEEDFVRRLRVYVSQKQESIHGPLEALLRSHTAAQQAKIEDATSKLTGQIAELKVQALSAVEEASKAASAAAQRAKTSADEEARQRRMKALQAPKARRLSQQGGGGGSGEELERRASEDGGVSPLLSPPQPCPSCSAANAAAAALQTQVEQLRAAAAGARASTEEAEQLSRQLARAAKELAEAKEREASLSGEVARLKAALAQGGERDAGVQREQLAQLADQARRLDATGAPPAPHTTTGLHHQAVATSTEEEQGRAGTAGSRGGEQGGLSEALERAEAMGGSEEGPLHAMRSRSERLAGQVAELEAECGRWRRHAEAQEEARAAVGAAAAAAAAVAEEAQRKAAHAEHLEFLAQQYSDQVQALQGQLRRLRDQLAEEQAQQADAADRARRLAAATDDAHFPAHAPDARQEGSPLPPKAPLAVRVRSSTLVAVRRSAQTLRAAVRLLRVDFQAYAEGIFLPLARELQRNTLGLSTSLSERSRELRQAKAAMGTAIHAQRLLDARLQAVYAVSFHSLAYLRPPQPHEHNLFRPPQPQSLTVLLRGGPAGESEQLETFDFEKVLGPDTDAAGMFRELTPLLSRVINWQSACLVLQGSRNSGRRELALGAAYVDESGRGEEEPGLLAQAVEFMALVVQDEQLRLLKARQQDAFDLDLFLELSEVVDDSVVHYLQDDSEVGGEGAGAGARAEPQRVSLFDVQNMLASAEDNEEDEAGGADEAAAEDSEHEEEAEEAAGAGAGPGAEGREALLPRCRIENAADGAVRLAGALRRREARGQLRQQEVERGGSERVARARRMAKPGTRNAEGELAAEGHLVLSVMMVKRERATEERQVGLLKVAVVGSSAEREAVGAEHVAFRREADQAAYALQQFLEKRYLRHSKLDAELAPSPLSALLWDCLGPASAVVLLTAVSPAAGDLPEAVGDLRAACTGARARPSTAARLERVKYRWQNQSAVWAFTLWRGAMADSERVQLANQLSNQQEENAELRQQARALEAKLEAMAAAGIHYASAGDSEPPSDDDLDDANDELAQQQRAMERIVGRDIGRIEAKSEAVVLQAVTAKLGFTKDRARGLAHSNRALSRLLAQHRALARGDSRPTKMPKLPAPRSATPSSPAPAPGRGGGVSLPAPSGHRATGQAGAESMRRTGQGRGRQR